MYRCSRSGPTGIAGENWRFLVVTEPEPKAEIATIYNEILLEISSTRDMQLKASHRALMSRLHQIPCMIFVYAIGEPDEMLSGQIGFFWVDTACGLVTHVSYARARHRYNMD